MSKKPFHHFWRPLHFEEFRKDIRLLDPKLVTLYLEVLEAFWLSEGRLSYTDFRIGLGSRAKQLDQVFLKVPSLSVVDGLVMHPHSEHELARAMQRSGNAKAAIAIRWRKEKGDTNE